MSRNITLYVKDILQNMLEAEEFIDLFTFRYSRFTIHVSPFTAF